MICCTCIPAMVVLFVALEAQRVVGGTVGKGEKILTEEQIKGCRNESNYHGDFYESEPSHEVKCFLACSMVKLELMNENDGTLNVRNVENYMNGTDGFVDKFKTDVLKPCIDEVKVVPDHCELAYDYVMCGMKKASQLKAH